MSHFAIQPTMQATVRQQEVAVLAVIEKLHAIVSQLIEGNGVLEKEVLEFEGYLKKRKVAHLAKKKAYEEQITSLSRRIASLERAIKKLSNPKNVLQLSAEEYMEAFRNVRDDLNREHMHFFGAQTTTKGSV
ncbi:MAG: hypothetical protein S4CHLAM45_07960 [Chlamydiales bacterium]|nr:hypothetical protein [Chlamydiales bacterium]MCH9619994.1 hypothetical protein [Chlamydiales bacterium]MCH9622902.1 hypothetical protein [Chlamydiales bacterium]